MLHPKFHISIAVAVSASLAGVADCYNDSASAGGSCPGSVAGQVLLQSTRGHAVKRAALDDSVSENTVPLWKQFGGSNQRCSGTEHQFVKDQMACQLLAVNRGHLFYSYNGASAPDKCDTSDTCDSPQTTTDDWTVYHTELWHPHGEPGFRCTTINPITVKNRLFCQYVAIKDGRSFYSYETSGLCNIAINCALTEATAEWQSYSVDSVAPTPPPTPYPAELQVDGFRIVGYGPCSHAQYSEQSTTLAADRDLCAKTCNDELRCAFFGFAPGVDCARWGFNDNTCNEDAGREIWDTRYVVYRKTPAPTPAPPPKSLDWTEEEVLITMAKIHATVHHMNDLRVSWKDQFECYAEHPNSSYENVRFVPCTYWCLEPVNPNGCGRFGDTTYYNERGVEPQPDMAMLVRFGFHMCFKNQDGTGGCNGCMNLERAFLRTGGLRVYPHPPPRSRPVGLNGHNANLALTADLLETIFTDPDYPIWAPVLPRSLKDSGKSRADLWALAATTAVHQALHQATSDCDNAYSRNIYAAELMPSGFPCKMSLQKPLAFYSGRTDCQDTPTLWGCEYSCHTEGLQTSCVADPGRCGGCLGCPRVETMDKITYRPRAYENMKAESSPADWWNGSMLTDFFAKDFGFGKRETVAIIGGHTLGVFHGEINGGHRYMWTHKQQAQLSNLYYRIIAALPGKHYEAFEEGGVHLPHPLVVGGAQNKKVETGFVLWNGNTIQGGGPFQWFHQYSRCPTCYEGKNADRHYYLWVKDGVDRAPRCCELCAKATYMHGGKVRDVSGTGGDKWVWRYETEGLDETEKQEFDAYGCLRNLSVHETMLTMDMALMWEIPLSPKGFPIVEGHVNTSATLKPWIKMKPNSLVDEESGKTMSEIVLEYANSQDLWINDFIAAWEKMLTNGVDTSAMKKSFEFDNVVCQKGTSIEETVNYVNKAAHTNWKCSRQA